MYQADSGEWQTVTVQFSSLSSSRAIQLSFSPYLVSQGGIGICVLAHPLNCQKFDFLKCESISILPHKKTGTVTWSEDGQNLLPMHIKKPKNCIAHIRQYQEGRHGHGGIGMGEVNCLVTGSLTIQKVIFCGCFWQLSEGKIQYSP